MKRYMGRVKIDNNLVTMRTIDGQLSSLIVLRRIGKDSIKKTKLLHKLEGRDLVFVGKRMGNILYVSKWMEPGYTGA